MTKKILAIFLSFIYSIAYIVVGPMMEKQSFGLDNSLVLPFILCFVLCSAINLLVFIYIPKWRFNIKNDCVSEWFNKIGDRKFFFCVWAFVFVLWIPAYLILYPTILSYDIISQVGSALGQITNNHHPVLHTWLIRFFMRLGEALFSSYEHGLGLFSLLQMLILSYALARLVLLLKKKKVPMILVLLTAFFSAIWFVNTCLAVTMVKDTLHAAFLILFVCHFTEIVMNPLEYSRKKRNLIFLPIISFFMCAFRNNGFHIYVFCFAALLFFRIAQIKKAKMYIVLIMVIILPVVIFKIYTGPVFKALHIEQGQVREMLSVPIQQLQRVAVHRADELTSEQTELMDYYIDNLAWMESASGRAYDPFISDPAKSCFYSNRYNENPIAFWKFYLQTGRQFPKEYIKAFLSNTLGYWYPGYYGFSYVMYENYPPEMLPEPLERTSIVDLQFLKKFYESVCSADFWRETVVLRLFFVPGFSIWLLIYALIFAWKKRGFFTKEFLLFLPLIAQFGIMILSPMSSFRYSWPFYLMLPIVFISIFGNKELILEKDKGAKTHLG